VELYRIVRRLLRSKRDRRNFLLGSFVLVLIGSIVAEFTLAPRHLPWHPLSIDDRAGFSTDIKLTVFNLGPRSWCERLTVASKTLNTTSLDPHDGDGSCGWSNAMNLDSSSGITLTGKPPYAMQCSLAAGAHIWLTSVNHRAREILGSELVRVHHVGTYSCRRMYNRSGGRMSEHAYANAWDVTGFELADGRIVSVQKHWYKQGPLQTFLHAARDDACNIFRVVLGPDYNDAHHDHLHVDMGSGLRCS
jgi:hypothetical protein